MQTTSVIEQYEHGTSRAERLAAMNSNVEIAEFNIQDCALDAMWLRYVALDEPVGEPLQTELGEKDLLPHAFHIGGFVGRRLVSNVSCLNQGEGVFVARRVGTLPEYRGLGFAARALTMAEDIADVRGAEFMSLYARPERRSYFAELSYEPTGKVINLGDRLNYEMVKVLD